MLRQLLIIFSLFIAAACSQKSEIPSLFSPKSTVDPDFYDLDSLHLQDTPIEIWTLDIEPARAVVILFHNGEENSLFWNEAQRLYKNGYSVVLSKIPNFGATKTTTENQILMLGQWVELVYTDTRNKLGNSQISLYGFGLGAQGILQAYTKLYPEPSSCIFHDAPNGMNDLFQLMNFQSTESYWLFWVNQKMKGKALPFTQMLKEVNSPILFVTGTQRNTHFSEHMVQLHNEFQGIKELAQFQKSTHGSIAYTEADAWEYIVTNFLENHQN